MVCVKLGKKQRIVSKVGVVKSEETMSAYSSFIPYNLCTNEFFEC